MEEADDTKEEKWETTIYKALHRKLKIKQHEHNLKPALIVAHVVLP
jgi:hypothetical protein